MSLWTQESTRLLNSLIARIFHSDGAHLSPDNGIHQSVLNTIHLFLYSYRYVIDNGAMHRFHYFMPSYPCTSCLIIRYFCSITYQRKEEDCFLFSQVNLSRMTLAFRTKTIDAESKCNYHRKTEYICIIAVLQTDIFLDLVFF